MSGLGDRHSGTLGGRLNELGSAEQTVTVAIEAETDEGEFKFKSMNEFKAYIANKRS